MLRSVKDLKVNWEMEFTEKLTGIAASEHFVAVIAERTLYLLSPTGRFVRLKNPPFFSNSSQLFPGIILEDVGVCLEVNGHHVMVILANATLQTWSLAAKVSKLKTCLRPLLLLSEPSHHSSTNMMMTISKINLFNSFDF